MIVFNGCLQQAGNEHAGPTGSGCWMPYAAKRLTLMAFCSAMRWLPGCHGAQAGADRRAGQQHGPGRHRCTPIPAAWPECDGRAWFERLSDGQTLSKILGVMGLKLGVAAKEPLHNSISSVIVLERA